MDEPLSRADARRLIREIIADGTVYFSNHARDEMANDNLAEIDCVNVLRGGVVDEGEWENGSWRYRVRTQRITVVVAFGSELELVVVTAWRMNR